MKSCHRTFLINLNVKYICSIRTLTLYSETNWYEKLFDMSSSMLCISKKVVEKVKYNTDNTSNDGKRASGKGTNTIF